MTTALGDSEVGTRILGIHVPAYKNLRDVWIPWHSGLALIGANGSGKTNLLEAMALLLGNAATMRRTGPRLAWSEAPGLALAVAGDHDRMPIDDDRATIFEESDPWLGYAQLRADKLWWDAVKPDAASPEWHAAIVRYTLKDIGLDDSGLVRTFRRDLLPAGRPPFADGAWAGSLLELSDTTQAPAVLQWLPALRDEDAVVEELEPAFAAALPYVSDFTDSIAVALGLPLDEQEGAGAAWLLHEHGAAVGNGELDATSSIVRLESEGAQPADWRLYSGRRDEGTPLGRIGDGPLGQLSAGQRRWADEALASVARELRALGQRARLYEHAISDLSDKHLAQAAVDTLDAADEIRVNGYWSHETFVSVLGSVGPAMTAAATAKYVDDPMGRRLVRC